MHVCICVKRNTVTFRFRVTAKRSYVYFCFELFASHSRQAKTPLLLRCFPIKAGAKETRVSMQIV